MKSAAIWRWVYILWPNWKFQASCIAFDIPKKLGSPFWKRLENKLSSPMFWVKFLVSRNVANANLRNLMPKHFLDTFVWLEMKRLVSLKRRRRHFCNLVGLRCRVSILSDPGSNPTGRWSFFHFSSTSLFLLKTLENLVLLWGQWIPSYYQVFD